MKKQINVFIVDDSAIVRQVLGEYIKKDPELNLIGVAPDPIFAMDKMASFWPDVIILDIEMPRMDGISFLKKIMTEHPTPIVICSTLAEENSDTTFIAIEEGAVEIITKPKIGLKGFLDESYFQIIDAVKAAASANLINHKKKTEQLESKKSIKLAHSDFQKSGLSSIRATETIIAIGTSTGGTIALEQVLSKLDRDKTPGIVIVQHMPEIFTKNFARRLNDICDLHVREAVDSERILPGEALIAPGNKHLQIKRSGAQYITVVSDGPLVNRHRPSVDVLFRSVAREAGKNAKGIIMTGMGDDGAQGLFEMKQAGAYTIAQNEESCVVFGMPKEAIRKGGVDKIVPLEGIYREIY